MAWFVIKVISIGPRTCPEFHQKTTEMIAREHTRSTYVILRDAYLRERFSAYLKEWLPYRHLQIPGPLSFEEMMEYKPNRKNLVSCQDYYNSISRGSEYISVWEDSKTYLILNDFQCLAAYTKRLFELLN
jgi:hypothetical protein